MNITQYNPKTVAIYSIGLIGGSIGAALKASGFGGKIIGLSSDKGLKAALDLGLIDEGYPYSKLPDIIPQADLLILCSPVLTIVNTIEKLGGMGLPRGLVITDIGSTKKVIVDAARKHLPPHVHFIGGHPMAGSEKSGPSASDSNLFKNAVYVLTSADGVDAGMVDELAEFLRKYLGCRTSIMDSCKHDQIVAAISHLPHILASALVLCADEQNKKLMETFDLAAGGFRDTTRIASASYDIWHDIFETNKGAIIPLIDSYIDILNDMKSHLADGTLKESFEKARQIRSSI